MDQGLVPGNYMSWRGHQNFPFDPLGSFNIPEVLQDPQKVTKNLQCRD